MRLSTDRLIIRSFTRDDIRDYAAIVGDPRVTRYLSNSVPHTLEESSAYIEKILNDEKESGVVRYAVTLKESSELIGFCGFKQIGESVDFGWRYGFSHWGRGYGTEAAIAVLEYGIKVLKLTNIFSVAMAENIASVKIIQKLGYQEHELVDFEGKTIVKYFNLRANRRHEQCRKRKDDSRGSV